MSQQEIGAETDGRYAIEQYERRVRSKMKTRYRVVDTETGEVQGVRQTLDGARTFARRVAREGLRFPVSQLTATHFREERQAHPGTVVETVEVEA